MYYEEKVINGVLHSRGTPDGEFRPMSAEQLTKKVLKLEKELRYKNGIISEREESHKNLCRKITEALLG